MMKVCEASAGIFCTDSLRLRLCRQELFYIHCFPLRLFWQKCFSIYFFSLGLCRQELFYIHRFLRLLRQEMFCIHHFLRLSGQELFRIHHFLRLSRQEFFCIHHFPLRLCWQECLKLCVIITALALSYHFQ